MNLEEVATVFRRTLEENGVPPAAAAKPTRAYVGALTTYRRTTMSNTTAAPEAPESTPTLESVRAELARMMAPVHSVIWTWDEREVEDATPLAGAVAAVAMKTHDRLVELRSTFRGDGGLTHIEVLDAAALCSSVALLAYAASGGGPARWMERPTPGDAFEHLASCARMIETRWLQGPDTDAA